MISTPSFTYEHYENTLNAYLGAGYFVGGFNEMLVNEPEGKYMILRHDVDISLDSAEKIARIEHKCGIKSSS